MNSKVENTSESKDFTSVPYSFHVRLQGFPRITWKCPFLTATFSRVWLVTFCARKLWAIAPLSTSAYTADLEGIWLFVSPLCDKFLVKTVFGNLGQTDIH